MNNVKIDGEREREREREGWRERGMEREGERGREREADKTGPWKMLNTSLRTYEAYGTNIHLFWGFGTVC